MIVMEWTELKVHEFVDSCRNLPWCETSRPTTAHFVAAPFGVVGELATLLCSKVARQTSGVSSAI